MIEAVFENQELKHKVFQEIEDIVEPNALLGSNTSTLPITGLATGVKRQEDFIGIHFFSPVDKMPLVEIIKGEKTSDATGRDTTSGAISWPGMGGRSKSRTCWPDMVWPSRSAQSSGTAGVSPVGVGSSAGCPS